MDISFSLQRIGNLISWNTSINTISNHQKSITLVGFASDQGTLRNNGRIGGSTASFIFFQNLRKIDLSPKQSPKLYYLNTSIRDQYNSLEQLHQQHYKKIKKLTIQKPITIPFIIGGSNDQSYYNVLGLLQQGLALTIINVDSHFDVRPLKQGLSHSGSPFRQLLQNPLFNENKCKFIQFGVKGATCSYQHYKYLKQKNVDIYWMQKSIRRTKKQNNRTQAGRMFQSILEQLNGSLLFLSFDVDSIDSAFMPGVSAPSIVGGLTDIQAIQIMELAGKYENIKMVDFSQFNPAVQSSKSCDLLIKMFLSFVQSIKNYNQQK